MNAPDVRRLYRWGYIWFAALLLLSAGFYRERATFLDIPLHLFELTRTGTFAIQNYRFVAVLTQWLPLAGIKVGLSLKALMLLYSLAFPLLYLFAYLVCGLLRQYHIGLAWLLAQTLFATHTFFWIQSELPQGLAVLTLCLALLEWQPAARAKIFLKALLLPVLLATLAFAHPLLLFPFGASAAFLLAYRKTRPERIWLGAACLIFLIGYTVKSRCFPTEYDSNAMNSVKSMGHNLLYINKLSSTHYVLRSWAGAYALMPLAFIAVCMAFRRAKAGWWRWLVFLAAFWGYLLLILLTNTDAGSPPFYRENLLLPLGIILALPLVLSGLPLLIRKPRTTALLLLLVGAGAAGRFAIAGRQYHERYAWLSNFCKAHLQEKLIVPETQQQRDTLIMTWATPYEWWLISTTTTGQTASFITQDQPQQLEGETHDPHVFLTRWGNFPYDQLPKRYFHFRDTVSTYHISE